MLLNDNIVFNNILRKEYMIKFLYHIGVIIMNVDEEILTEFKFVKSIAWQIEPSEDFVYVLNNKNRKWYFLKEVSKDIWLQVAQHKNLDNIIKTLMEEYQVDYRTLYDDVKNYIYELQEEGLVIRNE